MKGLLLKDWYMMCRCCRAYFLIAVVFILLPLFSENNLFFVFYPCLLCGMIPVNLLGYDERSRWLSYSATMPYTRTQIVCAKYLIGLFSQIVMLIATGTAQGIRMGMNGTFSLRDFAVMMLLLLTVSTVASSITLPFVFKLGVEKGRTAYYVMIGIVCALAVTASNVFNRYLETDITPSAPLVVVALVGVAIYALSWYLSVVFYKKREL